MKDNLFLGLGVLLIAVFLCTGCTTRSYITESVAAFREPVHPKDIMIGSFTYNSEDTYIVRPDESLIIDRTITQKDHEAYHEEQVFDSDGKPKTKHDTGEPITRFVLNDGYHAASDDEVYSWACRVAAENAGITNIIAIKSFTMAIYKGFSFIQIPSQVITITVYGEPLSNHSD